MFKYRKRIKELEEKMEDVLKKQNCLHTGERIYEEPSYRGFLLEWSYFYNERCKDCDLVLRKTEDKTEWLRWQFQEKHNELKELDEAMKAREEK